MLTPSNESATAPGEPGARPERPAAPLWVQVAIGAVALLAILIPVIIVIATPRVKPITSKVVISTRVVPKTELPPVEPVRLQQVSLEDAKAINEAIPFSTRPNPAARPFHLTGAKDSRTRAIDCLAAAVYYEAGDDALGQKAVAQVVLNRVRHPAYPKTVCGVVFQGQERSTGCQFTFTCDGAMIRYAPSQAAWGRARDVARMALTGTVYKPVGHATHYHTDWVVPYWSASLEKITAVKGQAGTHLFFRWTGWWGTPPAFNRGYAGVEPNFGKMARLSPAFSADPAALAEGAVPGTEFAIDPEKIPESAVPPATPADANSFLVTLPADMNAESFASLAIRTCGERDYCKFMGWTDAGKTPAKLPLNSNQVATMSFSYLRDQRQGFAKALWNCEQFRRPSPVQCMRAQPLADYGSGIQTPTARPLADDVKRLEAPAPLAGVRRKTEQPAQPQQTLTLPVAPKTAPAPAPRE